ncbi:hypothetical protein K7432_013885 [Basidiobolus ranarum]|uniref:ABC transmembrane type-1 domain-containing protein n=1 Tax=Basidiobolus ranarum TaxID=34480 RepID=A0ABR2WII3_9FUNG
MSGKTETKVFNEKDPKPEEDSLPINPEENANIFSHIVFWWLNSLMFKGYKRPLEKEDLYDLGETYSSHNLSVRFGNAWKGEFQRPKASLFHALHVTFGRRFWSAGFLKFLGDMAQTVSPLFVRAITNYVSESARHNEVHGLGYGFGLAVGLLLIQIFGTLCTHAYFHITMTTGFAIRSALITNIYKKSMVLSGKARQSFSAGKVTNIMSTDTSRIDMTCGYLQMLWLSPLQLVVALGLLIDTLGPSALAGFAVLVLFGPLQGTIMRKLAIFRRRAAAVTDQRVKITQEVLQGVKVIKFFAWEESFSQKLAELRNQELSNVQKLLIIRALIFSTALVIPVFASILSFVVYYLTDHDLNPGVVFASVALFNVLRLPLMLFPAIIGFTVDAKVSLGRIQELLLAPELDTLPPIEQSADFGIRVENGKFMWEAPPPEEEDAKMKKKRIKEEKKNKKMMKSKTVKSEVKQADNNEEAVTVENSTVEGSKSSEPQEETMPFLRDINFTIPKGKLVAVVGSVGSGKSSLLNALVGEMRLVDGSITFGGRVGYCPQTAWIQNATLKENIIFGLPFDEERYRRVLNVCALERDLEVLPGGDDTEIGERGINLSGGQKPRLNIARAV